MRKHPLHRRLLALLLAATAAGCGPSGASVEGSVAGPDGAAIPGVRVIARKDSTGAWASAVSDDAGKFRLTKEDNNPLLEPGEYVVVLSNGQRRWDAPGPRLFAEKYESAGTSGISFTAKPGEEVTLDLRLER